MGTHLALAVSALLVLFMPWQALPQRPTTANAMTILLSGESAHSFTLANQPHLLRPHPTPPPASVTRSMQVARTFLNAYNAHNLRGVLATLAANIDYGDCDYKRKISRVMHGKGAVAAWLRARFAEHDRLLHGTISVPGGAGMPQAVAIFGMTRVNDTLKAQHRSVVIAAKIGLTHDGRFLEALRMGGGNSECPSV